VKSALMVKSSLLDFLWFFCLTSKIDLPTRYNFIANVPNLNLHIVLHPTVPTC